MSSTPDSIDRREALRRTALLLGGALSAPAIAGVLAGCGDRRTDVATWKPRAFSPTQGEMLGTIAQHIIPATDTPGARDVGAHRFIDMMMAEYYAPADRARFVAGLVDLDTRAQQAHGRDFLRCDDSAQHALLTALDAETFGPTTPAAPPQREPSWFRTMKELTLLAYYTSEAGATRELRYESVPGRYEGCIPLAQVGRTWAV
jgi:hypothetical protein